MTLPFPDDRDKFEAVGNPNAKKPKAPVRNESPLEKVIMKWFWRIVWSIVTLMLLGIFGTAVMVFSGGDSTPSTPTGVQNPNGQL